MKMNLKNRLKENYFNGQEAGLILTAIEVLELSARNFTHLTSIAVYEDGAKRLEKNLDLIKKPTGLVERLAYSLGEFVGYAPVFR